MKSIIIALAGRIGSGKSTLAVALADTLQWPRVSFGDYVRKQAIRRRLDEAREVLQEIGASLIEEDTDKFCLSVLEQVSWTPGQHIVIDGIRHSKVLRSLRKLTKPSEIFLVFVNVDDSTRMNRLYKNNVIGKNNRFSQIEAHSTEVDVREGLPDMANLIVDGTRPKQDLVQEIVTWIQNKIEMRKG